jgi:hypothetical protein
VYFGGVVGEESSESAREDGIKRVGAQESKTTPIKLKLFYRDINVAGRGLAIKNSTATIIIF